MTYFSQCLSQMNEWACQFFAHQRGNMGQKQSRHNVKWFIFFLGNLFFFFFTSCHRGDYRKTELATESWVWVVGFPSYCMPDNIYMVISFFLDDYCVMFWHMSLMFHGKHLHFLANFSHLMFYVSYAIFI